MLSLQGTCYGFYLGSSLTKQLIVQLSLMHDLTNAMLETEQFIDVIDLTHSPTSFRQREMTNGGPVLQIETIYLCYSCGPQGESKRVG